MRLRPEGGVEAIAYGRGIASRAIDDLRGMTASAIFCLSLSGHPQATSLVHQSAQTIARLIADMKASYNCQFAVLGSGIGLAPRYISLVERCITEEPAAYHTNIVAAHYLNDAGLLDAALLAEENLP
jgi:N-acylmannosamine kinase